MVSLAGSSSAAEWSSDVPQEIDPAVAALALQLAELLARTSEESRFHLQTALGAAQFGGVGGDLVVRIPRKQSEHALVKWVGGGISAL